MVKFFLTEGPRTFDTEYRAWLARHPGAMWAGRIVVLTVAVLLATLIAGIVVPLLSPWIFVGLCLWGYLAHRDRQHREVLTALRQRPTRLP